MAVTGTELSDLRKLTVVKLRARLSKLGLPTGGLKADLVERLHTYYQQEADSQQVGGDDDDGDDNAGTEEDDDSMHESSQMSPPPVEMRSPPRAAPPQQQSPMLRPSSEPPTQQQSPPIQRRAPPTQHQPHPIQSPPLQQRSPPTQHQPPPTQPSGPAHITRTTLQMRLQQLAGGQTEEPAAQQAPPPSQQHQPKLSPLTAPKPLMSQQTPAPQLSSALPPAQQMMPQTSSTQMASPAVNSQQQQQQNKPQQLPPPAPPAGSPQNLPPSPVALVQPPIISQSQTFTQPPVLVQPPPPGLMAHSQLPPPGHAPPSPAQHQQVPPPPGVGPPSLSMGQVPPGMLPPPPQVSQAPQLPPPPGVGPPTSQMGQPPQMMPPFQRSQEPDFQEKVHLQTRLLEQERQQQQEKQRLLEQQQEKRLAMQKQAMLLQQPQPSVPLAPPGEEGPGDLMERVRQQQIMLEQQKRKEQLEQQEKVMLEQQSQAIKKQEEERKRKEVELVRQQMAIMEAQREEQSKRRQEERRAPPPTTSGSGPQPFNPTPAMLHAPRPMIPQQPSGGRPPHIPPQNAPRPMPPRMPSMGDQMRGQRPPMEDRAGQEPKDFKLPLALAKTLAYRAVRALEVGTTLEEWERENMPQRKSIDDDGDDEIEMVEMEEEDDVEEEPQPIEVDEAKKARNKAKKKKKKKSKKKKLQQQQEAAEGRAAEKSSEPNVEVEYVPEALDLDPTDPNYFTFNKIFEAFKIEEPKEIPKVADVVPEKPAEPVKVRNPDDDDDDDSDNSMDDKDDDKAPKMSKKKMKKMTRMSVAELKMQVRRPDLVEMHDVNAKDPILLLELKSTRNTVPVPAHWCFKRKYLQGKRGIEKAPFQLPEFIEATGITEMREAQAEKEDAKSLKGKMREKVRPKMGKIDIDYQKLHDAFFKYQVKPKLTIHGELYYEGKEFETRLREKKPGNLSDDLKTALGMPIGPGSDKMPPPWLIAMQRYGPPPSYPNLKIPGLNAPIPEGCSFGYHAGGWGKPPVNESGKPLYGDVFGTNSAEFETADQEEEIDKSHWGEMESESEEEEELESDEEEEDADESGLITPAEGLVTPSGITSIPVGMETPDMIELRKRRIEDAMDQGGETPALYQVIPEKKTTVGGAMMGSAHIYDVGALPAGSKKPGDKVAAEGIEVALNPEELDLDTAAMQAKYDQTLREQQSQLEKEDLSDMVAEHAAKQKKRKKKQEDSGKAAKKYKEFKF